MHYIDQSDGKNLSFFFLKLF